MEMYYDLNAVPDGARYLTLHPENRDPTGSATTALSADFLRPFLGYRASGSAGTRQRATTTRCRCR